MTGDGLVKAGFIDQEQMEQVLAKQRSGDDRRFGAIAIEFGFLTDDQMMRYLEMWARGESGSEAGDTGQSPGQDSGPDDASQPSGD